MDDKRELVTWDERLRVVAKRNTCVTGTLVPVPSCTVPSIAIDFVFAWLQYIVRKAMLLTRLRAIWYAMSGFMLPLRFALLCSILHTWRGWWRG
jgi:hypothetical protein